MSSNPSSNKISAQDPVDDPAQELSERIVSLYASINLASAQLLSLIAEFDENNFGERQGFLTTANWLNYKCGIGLTAAREKVRVARALQELPEVALCFGNGRISYSKVRALTRVATPNNENALLDIAKHATAAQAERIFQQYRQTNASAEARANKSTPIEPENEFSSHWDHDGYLVFRGRLSPEQGALVLAAMQREQDEGAERNSAISGVARRSLSSGTVATSESSSSELSTKNKSARAVSSADRYQIHIELDQETQHIRGGPGISNKLVERLTCDASFITHRCDIDGEPLDVGRKTRNISPALRRALTKRDGGCRFPGCTHRHFVDAHHVKHWANGGETKLANLLLLCTRHHTLVHEQGFSVKAVKPASGADRFEFYDPQGQNLPPVADDLSQNENKVLSLGLPLEVHLRHQLGLHVKSHASAEALAPINPTRRPDYKHINWVLTNFHPPTPLAPTPPAPTQLTPT